mmetsp:Transcript_20440/g.28517  ORF Transcript_20440/g.28517 Transcript_20440/m.28517 type:complete len:464 (+) Transcript_20440:117-1508(+)
MSGENVQSSEEDANKKAGKMSWMWSMTGGLISRIAGEGESVSAAQSKKGSNMSADAKPGGEANQVRGAQYPPPEQPSESKNTASDVPAPSDPIPQQLSPTAPSPDTNEKPAEAGEKKDGSSQEEKEKKGTPSVKSANALSRRAQIFKLINEPTLDLASLRRRAWSGLCPAVKTDSWQLMLGYQPAHRERRGPTVAKRRKEYRDHCRKHYSTDDTRYSESEKKIMHQIRLDTPRTLPGVKLLQHKSIQELLTRILYIWAIRHPASGYVQGINDLVVPFLIVFLASRVGVEPEQLEERHLLEEQLSLVEADCFWCLSKLIDGIQDNYTSTQPGIQRMVFKLEELVHRLDEPLHAHLKKYDIRFFHFSYRWMNCLLMREVSLPLIIRVWDTYIAEPDGFKVFHIYVCAAMLIRFSPDLRKLTEFQDLIVYLQNLPTKDWTEKDIETLLAQAYVYKYQFEGAENHLH